MIIQNNDCVIKIASISNGFEGEIVELETVEVICSFRITREYSYNISMDYLNILKINMINNQLKLIIDTLYGKS
jgi:hypothetical protein